MNRLLIIALVIAAGTSSFAQDKSKDKNDPLYASAADNSTDKVVTIGNATAKAKKNDPSYSAHNYKHADKAAWAADNNTDKTVTFENATVTDQRDYKHQFANKTKKKFVVSTFKGTSTPAASHKHPLGI